MITTCAKGGLYILFAHGSGEPAIFSDPERYFDKTGSPG